MNQRINQSEFPTGKSNSEAADHIAKSVGTSSTSAAASARIQQQWAEIRFHPASTEESTI